MELTTEDVAEALAVIDALHAAKAAAAPALALLFTHGAALEMSQAEIRSALALPVSVCKWLESPSTMCGDIDAELRQPPAPAPNGTELAELILRWCLT
jgi:hypothetical protein